MLFFISNDVSKKSFAILYAFFSLRERESINFCDVGDVGDVDDVDDVGDVGDVGDVDDVGDVGDVDDVGDVGDFCDVGVLCGVGTGVIEVGDVLILIFYYFIFN